MKKQELDAIHEFQDAVLAEMAKMNAKLEVTQDMLLNVYKETMPSHVSKTICVNYANTLEQVTRHRLNALNLPEGS